jgi:hypothetical protein
MAASTVAPWVVVLVTVALTAVTEPAGTGGEVDGGVVIASRAIVPSWVTQRLPSGPAVIPPEAGTGIAVMTPCVVIRPIPAPGLLPAK